MKAGHKLMAVGLVLGLLYWVIDAVVDRLFFEEGTFWGLLIWDVPAREVTERLLPLGVFVALGVLMSRLLAERRVLQEQADRLNQVLRAVRNVNQLLAREQDRDRLLQGACDRLVAARPYYSAWIVLLDEDGSLVGGWEAGPGDSLPLLRELLQQGTLPICAQRALGERGVVSIVDVAASCGDCPLAAAHAGRGVIAARLEHAGQVRGLLCVSLPVDVAASEEEQSLLEEVSGDIALGIIALEAEAERKRARAQLRQSEDLLRATLESTADGILAVGERGQVIHCNSRFAEMWRIPKEVIRTRDDQKLLDYVLEQLQEPEAFLARVQDLYQTPREAFDTLTFKDGRVFERFSCPLIRDQKMAGRVWSFRDITERKRAEQALRESERRFREMADLLPDMIYETDENLRLTYANRAALETFGYSREDLEAGIHVADLLAPDAAARATEHLGRMAETKEPAIGVYQVKRKDGSHVPCEIHSAPVQSPDGTFVGYRGVMRDVTERIRAEEAQRLAAVGELASGIAHEFNNILFGMSGRAELAQLWGTQEAYEQLIGTVLSGTDRAAKICNDLMSFARPLEPRREPIAIETPLDQALALAERELRNAQVVVTRRYETEGQHVHADAGQLEQVFLNLIINACHAMAKGGRLLLETAFIPQEDGPGQIVATVSDTGSGISAEDLPRIFEPFFTTKGRLGESDVAGTGLGLSVAHGIVSAHGGTLNVHSELGVGTTFELRLPAYEGEEARASQPDKLELQPEAGAGRTVLVVEDEQEIRETVRALLGEEGYDVVAVATTDEALEALGRTQFDAVISDVLLPGAGGREVLAAARRLPNPPPVLLVSGRGEEELGRELIESGAAGLLRKPFGLGKLLEALQNVLGDAG